MCCSYAPTGTTGSVNPGKHRPLTTNSLFYSRHSKRLDVFLAWTKKKEVKQAPVVVEVVVAVVMPAVVLDLKGSLGLPNREGL